MAILAAPSPQVKRILESLGIDSKTAVTVDILFRPGDIVKIIVEYNAEIPDNEELGKFEKELKKYKLVEIEEEE